MYLYIKVISLLTVVFITDSIEYGITAAGYPDQDFYQSVSIDVDEVLSVGGHQLHGVNTFSQQLHVVFLLPQPADLPDVVGKVTNSKHDHHHQDCLGHLSVGLPHLA